MTVDAYDGVVTFYVADATDPIVRDLRPGLPGLLQPAGAACPPDLQRHIRYPEDFFAIQARKYATYHMEDPQVFYNKEDLWAIPRRTVEGRDQRDGALLHDHAAARGVASEEFILLTLFNPSRRDNMIAWLAARSGSAELRPPRSSTTSPSRSWCTVRGRSTRASTRIR